MLNAQSQGLARDSSLAGTKKWLHLEGKCVDIRYSRGNVACRTEGKLYALSEKQVIVITSENRNTGVEGKQFYALVIQLHAIISLVPAKE